jgi:ribose transport system substrate-binding protein
LKGFVMKPRFALLVAAGAALSLTACSSSTVAGGSTTTAAPVSGADATVQAAQADLQAHTALPTFTAPNEAFDITKVKGKTIAIVAVDQTTPSLVYVAQGVQEAAKAAGLKTTLFDAKDNPSDMTAGVAQAIAAHAGAIVLDGIPVALVTKQLADAAAAKIPIVNADNNQPDPSAPGQGAGENIFATAAPDFTLQGKLAAEAAIVKTGGNVKAVLVNTEGITPAPAVMNGFTQGLQPCSTCKVLDTKSVQLQDWSTGLTTLTTSALSANADANILLPIYVTMAVFMLPAVQQAGSSGKVSIFSTSGPPDAAKVLSGNATLGGLAGNSEFETGWLAVNQSMRGMLGLQPGTPTVPSRYITADTVKQAGTSEQVLYGDAYEAGYKQLWGLS